MKQPRQPLTVEPLEARQLGSASPAARPGARPWILQPPTVAVSHTGTVRVMGTDGDESVRLRRLGRQTLEVTFAITPPAGFDPGRDRLIIESPRAGSGVPAVARGSVTVSAGLTLTAAVPLDGVRHVIVDGGGGHDVLTLARLPFVTQATHVERQHAAAQASPPGQTPSDPALHPYKTKAAWFKSLQRKIVDADASSAGLAFFGDSHVDHFLSVGRRHWNAHFAGALNLGIGGEGTRQMLFRIRAGQFDHYRPRVLVVTCGTNNLNLDQTGTDAQIAAGVRAVVTALRDKLPDTRIVVIGIFPRTEAGLNERVRTLNAATAGAADRRHIFFLDLFDQLAGAAGAAVRTDLFLADGMHLNAAGYRVLADRITTVLGTL